MLIYFKGLTINMYIKPYKVLMYIKSKLLKPLKVSGNIIPFVRQLNPICTHRIS